MSAGASTRRAPTPVAPRAAHPRNHVARRRASRRRTDSRWGRPRRRRPSARSLGFKVSADESETYPEGECFRADGLTASIGQRISVLIGSKAMYRECYTIANGPAPTSHRRAGSSSKSVVLCRPGIPHSSSIRTSTRPGTRSHSSSARNDSSFPLSGVSPSIQKGEKRYSRNHASTASDFSMGWCFSIFSSTASSTKLKNVLSSLSTFLGWVEKTSMVCLPHPEGEILPLKSSALSNRLMDLSKFKAPSSDISSGISLHRRESLLSVLPLLPKMSRLS